MNIWIARCTRVTAAVWAARYAIPLRFVVSYGFVEHGYANRPGPRGVHDQSFDRYCLKSRRQ